MKEITGVKSFRFSSLLLAGWFAFIPLLRGAANAKPDLQGVVTREDGSPVSKATIFIYTAAPRQGVSSICPSCYVDCSKHSRTDAAGRFKIESLDPSLIFQLLIVAEGHASKLVPKVDPVAGSVKVVLDPLDPAALDPGMRMAGMIIGADGKPVAGALIDAGGAKRGSTTQWGGVSRFVDPIAVTDEAGHFFMLCKEQVDAIHATVHGRGFAKRWVELKPGRDHLLRVEEGVTVTGRVLREGRPLKDVVIGLVTSDMIAGHMLSCTGIASDKDGRFLLSNVPPGTEFVLYATMDSLKGRGAVPEQKFTTGKTGTTWDAGSISVQPGYRLAGRVLLSDNKPIPPGVRLHLAREKSADTAEALLNGKGAFEFTDLPTGPVSLTVQIKGYKSSKRNRSLDWLSGGIVGTVDRDILDLKILLEPGKWRYNGEEEQDSKIQPEGGDLQPSSKPLRGATL